MNFIKLLLQYLPLVAFISCAHSKGDPMQMSSFDDSNIQEIALNKAELVNKPEGNIHFQHSTTQYFYDEQAFGVEWGNCFNVRLKNADTVLMMHDINQGFQLNEDICDQWASKSFIEAGYHVVFVNRPGYGQSTGKSDDVGPLSIEALEIMFNDFHRKFSSDKKIVGIWGYGFGSIAAALLGRKVNGLEWLIMGGGIFDLDAALASTKDEEFKAKLTQMKQASDHALAIRSVTFDIEGLPKHIFLYHGQEDKVVPLDNVKLFKSILSDLDVDVHLKVLNASAHQLKPTVHQQVLRNILAKITEEISETSAQ